MSAKSSSDFDWEAPTLSDQDAQLVSVYTQIGRSLDDLPYTPELVRIVESLGLPDTDENKHGVFLRLLRLRKMGRLPRLSGSSSSSSSSSHG